MMIALLELHSCIYMCYFVYLCYLFYVLTFREFMTKICPVIIYSPHPTPPSVIPAAVYSAVVYSSALLLPLFVGVVQSP